MSANLNMTRQAHNRFLEDWDDDYLEQINKLHEELRAAQRRIAAVEKERDNLITTCASACVMSVANRRGLESSSDRDSLIRRADSEVDLLLADDHHMARVRNYVQRCMKTPWRIQDKTS